LGVDKNGEEKSSSKRKGELHDRRDIIAQSKETGHEGLLSWTDMCASTNDLLSRAK
jgi:hypothetical protein